MKLQFVQQFGKDCWMQLPAMCNQQGCSKRSHGTWQDDEHNVFYLCEEHRIALNAPPITPGVEYAPTMALMSGWAMRNGKPTRIVPV
jgi:hypothetical protein